MQSAECVPIQPAPTRYASGAPPASGAPACARANRRDGDVIPPRAPGGGLLGLVLAEVVLPAAARGAGARRPVVVPYLSGAGRPGHASRRARRRGRARPVARAGAWPLEALGARTHASKGGSRRGRPQAWLARVAGVPGGCRPMRVLHGPALAACALREQQRGSPPCGALAWAPNLPACLCLVTPLNREPPSEGALARCCRRTGLLVAGPPAPAGPERRAAP
jgi:hypothetical protein